MCLCALLFLKVPRSKKHLCLSRQMCYWATPPDSSSSACSKVARLSQAPLNIIPILGEKSQRVWRQAQRNPPLLSHSQVGAPTEIECVSWLICIYENSSARSLCAIYHRRTHGILSFKCVAGDKCDTGQLGKDCNTDGTGADQLLYVHACCPGKVNILNYMCS